MPLGPGTHLGPYAIVAPLGAGGMGEVYRALDPRLGREVAVKVLPETLSADPERLRRFEQEARATAALNHPNILAIFDIGRAGPHTYIVSELLEGETLREAITGVNLPIRKAVELGTQIAHGLAAAHSKGIVHRDLKPENLFITTDGRAKILDFGLAKLADPVVSAQAGLSMQATLSPDTTPGTILGTVGYMSPEQVRGREVDHRSDLFALGAILYEMLAGRRAFHRETAADTMSAILREDTPDLPLAERHIPPALARIVDRALEKPPDARFQSAGDLAFALEGLSSSSAAASPVDPPAPEFSSPSRVGMAWAVAAAATLAGVASTAAVYVLRTPLPPRPIAASILPPSGFVIGGTAPPSRVAVSPDGTMVAFVAQGPDGLRQIWLRRMDALAAQPVPGTTDGALPFWSPDSRAIGFFAEGRLKRVDAVGGPVVTVVASDNIDLSVGVGGGTWNRDGVIVFAAPTRGLYRVTASGGVPVAVSKAEAGESRSLPWFLPDGEHLLYRLTQPFSATANAGPLSATNAVLRLASLSGGEERTILEHRGSHAMYADGHLFYTLGATLMAHAFDVDRLTFSGEPFPVVEDLLTGGGGNSAFSVSSNGVIVFQGGQATIQSELVWIDREGRELERLGQPGDLGDVAVSPDGTRALVSLLDPTQGTRDLWMIDLERGLRSRFTFDAAEEQSPVWSPDGTWVVFASRRGAVFDLFRKDAVGVGAEQLLIGDERSKAPWHVSADGQFLLYSQVTSGGGATDLWVLPLGGSAKAYPLAETPAAEIGGAFSPDGRWVAYQSNESGRFEVYVVPFPGPGGKRQLSTMGGTFPKWRSDGREIVYGSIGNTGIVRVAVNGSGSGFEVGESTPTLGGTMRGGLRNNFGFPRTADKFLINRLEINSLPPLTVLSDWRAQRRP